MGLAYSIINVALINHSLAHPQQVLHPVNVIVNHGTIQQNV